jgi:hypothetical protein
MKHLRLYYLFVILGLCLLPAAGKARDILPAPEVLQCEYQTNPIGLDAAVPRFSWQLSDPGHVRGQAQTACHILVASSPGKLTVYVPATKMEDLSESGKAIGKVKGITPKGMENGYAVLRVEAGLYQLRIRNHLLVRTCLSAAVCVWNACIRNGKYVHLTHCVSADGDDTNVGLSPDRNTCKTSLK